jgi:hypothetical protein
VLDCTCGGRSLVSREDLVATSGGRAVELIGAYADRARTVLILRTLPATGAPQLQVSDARGLIYDLTTTSKGKGLADGSWMPGVVGDQIVEYRTTISIPDAPPIDYGGKGGKAHPPSPTDFPAAQQSLNLQGAIMGNVSTANPQSCGDGYETSGSMFAFEAYFQSNGAWYYVSFHTDSTIEKYHGPGTHKARAALSPVSPLAATSPTFEGTPQLTITTDTGLHRGSVNGTLGWTDDPNQIVRVSGTWTCMSGQGPGLG